VFFVVTTREEADYRLDVDHETEFWIRDEDPANQQDVARYIERFLDDHPDPMQTRLAEWRLSPKAFTEELASLSEGNFMYLVHVLPEVARADLLGRGATDGVKALPRGLKGYYRRHWRDMKDADSHRFTKFQRPVLCFLAISREPITVPQLVEWTGLEPGEVKDVIREWREFLNEDPGAECHRGRGRCRGGRAAPVLPANQARAGAEARQPASRTLGRGESSAGLCESHIELRAGQAGREIGQCGPPQLRVCDAADGLERRVDTVGTVAPGKLANEPGAFLRAIPQSCGCA
jgi:hypothetical protein